MGLDTLASGTILARLGIALGLGLLIGLEREYSRIPDHKVRAAGFRTHGLIALWGVLTALLADRTGPAVLAMVWMVLALLVLASYILLWLRDRTGGLGFTSEVAIFLTFLIGALVAYGHIRESVVATGAICVLLSAKSPMHRFVGALSTNEWVATMKFAVISLVVLPILPNEAFGPYHAFNPFELWFLVVLVSGISFFGYVLNRIVGSQLGIALTGLIGGLLSGTAVTLAQASRSREQPELSDDLALATILGFTVTLPRLLLIIAAVGPSLIEKVAVPFGAMALVTIVYSWWLYRHIVHTSEGEEDEPATATDMDNPFELGTALKFAAVFLAVVFLVNWANATGLGQGGIYAVSFISGMVKTDAIVVALAGQITGASELAKLHAVNGIVLAVVGGALLKIVIAERMGERRHGRIVRIGLLASVVAGTVATLLMYSHLPG